MRRDGSFAIAVLPALGSSLSDHARHGQLDRLLTYYFPAYLERFRRIRFFSYEPERLEDFTDDVALRRNVELVTPTRVLPRRAAAVAIATGPRRAALRECVIARVLQAPGALPALLTRTPYVCTYGYDYAQFTEIPPAGPLTRPVLTGKRLLMRAGLTAVLGRAATTIVTTKVGEAQARDLGARDVVEVPNGVDLDRFAPRQAAQEYDVMFVGRLTPQKDLATLLRALAQLEDVTCAVVGDGPLRAELETEAARLEVAVRFFGTIDTRRVPDLLGRTRTFVLPSRFEGHPKALLEALAAGVACVASDIAATRDLAADEAVALFPPGDDVRLATTLRRLLADADSRGALAARGRALAVRRFDLRTLLGKETDLLAEIATRHGRTAP